MKTSRSLILTALAIAAAPAFAQVMTPPPPEPGIIAAPAPVPAEPIFVRPNIRNGSPIHGGYVTPSDSILLNDVVLALDSDRQLKGSTVTIIAKNGELIMNGTADNLIQAARMERIAKNTARGPVTAWFSTSGGA